MSKISKLSKTQIAAILHDYQDVDSLKIFEMKYVTLITAAVLLFCQAAAKNNHNKQRTLKRML